jgi:hypothetical protein
MYIVNNKEHTMISITLSIKEARMIKAALGQELTKASTVLSGRDILSLSRIQGDLAFEIARVEATDKMGVK